MLRPAERACLLIADISGFTGYLTTTELEHAQDVIADFLEGVIGNLEPAFELIETEGDAVFVVAALDGLNGQLVLDVADATYFTFRRHARTVVASTTCTCKACRQIPTLDLKFVLHSGDVVRSRIGRRENIAGEPVIVAHRLLKNSVVESFGRHAYLLVTETALSDLGLRESDLVCSRVVESYDAIGDIAAVVIDMEDRWHAAEAAASARLRAEPGLKVHERILPAPVPRVWDWLTDPRKRLLYEQGTFSMDERLAAGRRDVGTTVHCSHGSYATDQELLEWLPFERFTWQIKMPDGAQLKRTVVLEPIGSGTLVREVVGLPPEAAGDPVDSRAGPPAEVAASYQRLEDLLEEARRARP